MRVKSAGIAPGLANAWPPGSAKFANAPPLGLTRRANARGGGGGWLGQLEFTDALFHRSYRYRLSKAKAGGLFGLWSE